MDYLLTSGGIKNPTIRAALEALLSKPITECDALCIPTAVYAFPNGSVLAANFIRGEADAPMCELPWKSVGILELTALQSLDPNIWLPALQAADVLLVNGGDPMFLHEWMRRSGVAELLPTLKAVYVGMSAGSMILAKNIGKCFVGWKPSQGGDETLGVVDFAIFPHLNHPELPKNNLEVAQKWAAGMHVPTYVLDDQTAIVVKNGDVRVVSEGQWHYWPLSSKTNR